MKRLENALTKLDGQEKADAEADVKELRSFFEKRMEDEKKKAALVQTMKTAVSAAKLFKKHSRKISVDHSDR